jgi:hypothetical protein
MNQLVNQGKTKEADAWAQVVFDKGLKEWLERWAHIPPIASTDISDVYDQTFKDVEPFLLRWSDVFVTKSNSKRALAVKDQLTVINQSLAERFFRK